jgi:hypothetical protein
MRKGISQGLAMKLARSVPCRCPFFVRTDRFDVAGPDVCQEAEKYYVGPETPGIIFYIWQKLSELTIANQH